MKSNISLIPSFNPPLLKDISKQTSEQRLSSLLSNHSSKKSYQPCNKVLQQIKPDIASKKIEENHDDEIILFDGKVKLKPLTNSIEITNDTDSSSKNTLKLSNNLCNVIDIPNISKSEIMHRNNACEEDSRSKNQTLQLSSLLSEPITTVKKHDFKSNQLTSKGVLINNKTTTLATNREPESLVTSDDNNLRKKPCLHYNYHHHYQQDDFIGIDNICRNAGNSMKALQITYDKIKVSKSLICSTLWKGLKTNHVSTTIKYCTNKMKCINWNCTCDHQIRRDFISNNLLGIVFYLPDEANITYFLPLVQCIEPNQNNHQSVSVQDTSFSSSQYELPLACQTSLSDRWKMFLDVMKDPMIMKVIYNAQLALIPFMNHESSLIISTTTISTIHGKDVEEEDNNTILTRFQNIFDPRQAANICDINSITSEAHLELNALLEHYQIHLPSIDNHILGSITRAIAIAKQELIGVNELYLNLSSKLNKNNILSMFHTIEMPVTCLLASMEYIGVAFSKAYMDDLKAIILKQILKIESDVYVLAGFQFNIASPEQVARVLYEVLKLPIPVQQSKKGKHYSTSEEDLQKIIQQHPIVKLILNHRTFSKLISTYIDGMNSFLLKHYLNLSSTHTSHHISDDMNIDLDDTTTTGDVNQVLMHNAMILAHKHKQLDIPYEYRIHANWHQTIVRTGRLSCSKPNLQNIPNTQTIDDITLNIRHAFEASIGCSFISADYSQMEMRVLAHICNDSAMIALFRQDKDIYRSLASVILNKSSDKIIDSERNQAKVICLGVIYGMGSHLTAAKLGVSVSKANQITEDFFKHFKQLKAWSLMMKNKTKEVGFVCTLLGRRRYLPDIKSIDSSKAHQAERQAINTIIQGTASEIIKYAMILIDQKISHFWPKNIRKPCLLMQIHDELIYEVLNQHETILKFQSFLKEVMEVDVMNILKLQVPLVIHIKHGNNWGNLIAS